MEPEREGMDKKNHQKDGKKKSEATTSLWEDPRVRKAAKITGGTLAVGSGILAVGAALDGGCDPTNSESFPNTADPQPTEREISHADRVKNSGRIPVSTQSQPESTSMPWEKKQESIVGVEMAWKALPALTAKNLRLPDGKEVPCPAVVWKTPPTRENPSPKEAEMVFCVQANAGNEMPYRVPALITELPKITVTPITSGKGSITILQDRSANFEMVTKRKDNPDLRKALITFGENFYAALHTAQSTEAPYAKVKKLVNDFKARAQSHVSLSELAKSCDGLLKLYTSSTHDIEQLEDFPANLKGFSDSLNKLLDETAKSPLAAPDNKVLLAKLSGLREDTNALVEALAGKWDTETKYALYAEKKQLIPKFEPFDTALKILMDALYPKGLPTKPENYVDAFKKLAEDPEFRSFKALAEDKKFSTFLGSFLSFHSKFRSLENSGAARFFAELKRFQSQLEALEKSGDGLAGTLKERITEIYQVVGTHVYDQKAIQEISNLDFKITVSDTLFDALTACKNDAEKLEFLRGRIANQDPGVGVVTQFAPVEKMKALLSTFLKAFDPLQPSMKFDHTLSGLDKISKGRTRHVVAEISIKDEQKRTIEVSHPTSSVSVADYQERAPSKPEEFKFTTESRESRPGGVKR